MFSSILPLLSLRDDEANKAYLRLLIYQLIDYRLTRSKNDTETALLHKQHSRACAPI